MVLQDSSIINLVAGGVGGTAGAVVTCPLEVVKVRLQSSKGSVVNGNGSSNGSTITHKNDILKESTQNASHRRFTPQSQFLHGIRTQVMCSKSHGGPSTSTSHMPDLSTKRLYNTGKLLGLIQYRGNQTIAAHESSFAIVRHLKLIIRKEGYKGLFKGLGPNLVGIAPSKATYFYAYSSGKLMFNDILPKPDTPLVHMISAAYAGFIAATVVNPIWLVKTRMQLDKKETPLAVNQCIRNVYNSDGLRGFYKGVTASYAGISETMLQFVLYEYLRSVAISNPDRRQEFDFFKYMICGASAKLVATVLAYPHEVVRTRMREEGSKYKGFFSTLVTVASEERWKALYRGLSVHLLRTIPNTAVTMGTYELVLVLLKSAVDN